MFVEPYPQRMVKSDSIKRDESSSSRGLLSVSNYGGWTRRNGKRLVATSLKEWRLLSQHKDTL